MVIIIFILIAAPVVFLVKRELERRALLKWGKEFYENLYILPTNPQTGEQAEIGSHLEGVVIHVHPRRIMEEAANWRELFRKAKNPLFENKNLSTVKQIHVIPIPFQHGERVNESWESFVEYAVATIESERVARHTMLKKNPDWYNKNHHKQVFTGDKNTFLHTIRRMKNKAAF